MSGKLTSTTRTIRTRVDQIVIRLRNVQSAAVVAAAALRHQNSDRDGDIASLLERSVVDPIQDQIDQLSELPEQWR